MCMLSIFNLLSATHPISLYEETHLAWRCDDCFKREKKRKRKSKARAVSPEKCMFDKDHRTCLLLQFLDKPKLGYLEGSFS